MKSKQSSRTAAQVAVARSFGEFLPGREQLAYDSYGVRFGGRSARALARWPGLCRRLLSYETPWRGFVLWMQLRTRALDDLLLEFLRSGGDQVVILGAGFDCRTLRFESELRQSKVYEVDHPATQARKRERLDRWYAQPDSVEYLAWDFEAQSAQQLPAALFERGLDPSKRTLVLWEGVTMYLSVPAIETTVACVRRLCAPGSIFAFNYIERRAVGRDVTALAAAVLGERQRFGWDARELPQWLAARGFELLSQRSDQELAAQYLPHRVSPRRHSSRRIAIAKRF